MVKKLTNIYLWLFKEIQINAFYFCAPIKKRNFKLLNISTSSRSFWIYTCCGNLQRLLYNMQIIMYWHLLLDSCSWPVWNVLFVLLLMNQYFISQNTWPQPTLWMTIPVKEIKVCLIVEKYLVASCSSKLE